MPPTVELIQVHVRDICRALTGSVIDRESSTRRVPMIDEHAPPFAFSPLLDMIDCEDHIVLELAVPGVGHEDVQVACSGEYITIYGVRGGGRGAKGHHHLHAEIPRGSFYRVVRISTAFVAEPRMEVERGMIRVCLSKVKAADSEQIQK